MATQTIIGLMEYLDAENQLYKQQRRFLQNIVKTRIDIESSDENRWRVINNLIKEKLNGSRLGFP